MASTGPAVVVTVLGDNAVRQRRRAPENADHPFANATTVDVLGSNTGSISARTATRSSSCWSAATRDHKQRTSRGLKDSGAIFWRRSVMARRS